MVYNYLLDHKKLMIYVKISIELIGKVFYAFLCLSPQRCINVLMCSLLIHYAAQRHKHNFSKKTD